MGGALGRGGELDGGGDEEGGKGENNLAFLKVNVKQNA
jgi:hypothetical protein